MSEQQSHETQVTIPELQKISSMFKEETWTKQNYKELGPKTFQELRQQIEQIQQKGQLSEAEDFITEYMDSTPDSIYGQYLNGVIALLQGRLEGPSYFKRLFEIFRNIGKWSNVEYFSRLILEFTENKNAYRYLAQALEKLGKQKEAMATWETLARLDKDSPDVAQKVGEHLVNEGNYAKGLYFLRQALEGNIRQRDMSKLDHLWKSIIDISPDDKAYLEKIEKMLTEARAPEKLSRLIQMMLSHFRKQNDEVMTIELLKKVLKYTPANHLIRKELVDIYKKRYANHSRLEDILNISQIENNKKPAVKAIETFEAHAALDKGNYVHHRSWGVGKIVDTDSDAIYIDFEEKKNHRMALEMALPSLQPLSEDHIWVQKLENIEPLKDLFQNDIIAFFEILFASYDNTMTLSEIRSEITPDFLPSKDWSKWWTKARNILKKNPKFGISEKKRDAFFLRDKPISFSEDILSQFDKNENFDKRVSIAMDFIDNAGQSDLNDATYPHLIDYFTEQARDNQLSSRLIANLIVLYELLQLDEGHKPEAEQYWQRIKQFIDSSPHLATIARGVNQQELKRLFLAQIQDQREDWPKIFRGVLFETPIKIHKFLISELMKEEQLDTINIFIEEAFAGYKENPEIFLWTVKNITQGNWTGSWINYNPQDMILFLMRLMLQLPRIEQKGTKLKNLALDIFMHNDYQLLKETIQNESIPFATKIMDLARGLSLLDKSIRQQIQDMAIELRPELKDHIGQPSREEAAEKLDEEEDLIYVSQEGFDKKQALYNDIVTNQIPAVSDEIGHAAAYGDLRENAEYKAALEKQGTLKANVAKLQEDLNRAKVMLSEDINTDEVSFGTKVRLFNEDIQQEEEMTILGPWDADHTQNIISYKAPLGRAFLGKKVNEQVRFNLGGSEKKYKILGLEKAY